MSDFNPEVTSDDKLWAALAYALSPIVPIILLLMENKKNRPFIKANNMQALVVGLANFIIGIILGITVILACLAPIVALVIWIYQLYLAYQAYQGKTPVIPLVSDFCKNQGWS